MRQLDLKNSDVIIFNGKGEPELKARLRAGKYEGPLAVGSDWLRLNWLKILEGESEEPTSAIAEFDRVVTAGSASDYGIVQVFHLDDDHLKVVQQFLFNTRGTSKAGSSYDAKTNVLAIRGVHRWEHCCPTQLDIVEFHFEGRVFKQTAYHRGSLQ
jgi:hypothetical protein